VYNTWVRPARQGEGPEGVFCIVLPDAATRDWFVHRLDRILRRHLAGLVDAPLEIVYQIEPEDSQKTQDSDPLRVADSSQVIHNVSTGLSTGLSESDQARTADPSQIVHISRGLKEAIQRPERIHVMPAYLLRWIPYLGTGPFWTMVGFRQALYEQSGCAPKEQVTFEISLRRVADLIGANKDTVKSHRDDGRLQWFLEYNPTRKYNRDPISGEARRVAHEYAFLATAPPTPGDQDLLQEWLLNEGIESGPLQALKRARQLPARDILGYPAAKPTALQKRRQPDGNSRTFLQVILSLLPPDLGSERRTQLLEAAELLVEHLVAGFGQVFMSHYFLGEWLPLLGASPGLAITLARQHGYYNTRTGELREKFVLPGGYEALATQLGKSLNTTVQFMPTISKGNKPGAKSKSPQDMNERNQQRAARRQQVRAYTEQFIYESRRLHNGKLGLGVSMQDPLTPDHAVEYRQALDLIGWFYDAFGPQPSQQQAENFVDFLLESEILLSASPNIGFSDITNLDNLDNMFVDFPDKGDLEFLDNTVSVFSDIRSEANPRDSDKEMIANSDKEQFEEIGQLKFLRIRCLNASEFLDFLLRMLETPLNYPLTPPEAPTTGSGPRWLPVVGETHWSWDVLIHTLRIPKNVQKKIAEQQASAAALVSHLLHAFSPQGEGIRVPWRYATSRVLQDPQIGFSPRHDRLAALGPDKLQILIRTTSERMHQPMGQAVASLHGVQDWVVLMSAVDDREQLLDLAELLGLCER
jgi:hypothetical protein